MAEPRINSRQKGAAAEREFCRAIHDALGVRFVRNLEQSRGGGHDLVVAEGQGAPNAEALDRYAIEVKRYSKATIGLLSGWWGQACRQAGAVNKVPLLAYREDRQPWKVVMPLWHLRASERRDDVDWMVTLAFDDFAGWIRQEAGHDEAM